MMMGGQSWSSMPPVVKNLLILNGLMYLASFSFMQGFGVNFWEIFGLHYFQSDLFEPFQVVTYMFMHSQFDLSHLLFNMFAVWMFGSTIESVWGSKRFLIYYLLTGFGAAFLHYAIIAVDLYPLITTLDQLVDAGDAQSIAAFMAEHNYGNYVSATFNPKGYALVQSTFSQAQLELAVNPDNTQLVYEAREFLLQYRDFVADSPNVVGASGALFGILLAFGMMFPNVSLYMMFIPIPIKAKYFVIGYGAIELYSAFSANPGDNVAHFAHLGGMLFGFNIIKFWQTTGKRWR